MSNPNPATTVTGDRNDLDPGQSSGLPQRRPAFVLPSFKELLRDIIGQFYPNLCLCCGKNHVHIHDILCLKCHLGLPRTNDHLHPKNISAERLWGRLPLQACAALYKFTASSDTRHLIHRLKYERHPEVGVALGEFYGSILKTAPVFNTVECIVPVPLHPRKRRMRGYNQSEEFGKGLAKSMEIPQYPHGLLRTVFTKSQTQKSRSGRFENVERVFKLGNWEQLKGKHVLLVDDVLTTGATLEFCGLPILELPDTKLSIATIAVATNG